MKLTRSLPSKPAIFFILVLGHISSSTCSETFEETLYEGYGQKLTIQKVLHQESTEHQEMILFSNQRFGVCLALDGAMQVTQKDEFIYHEMLAHVPFYLHPQPKSALVIGGGDGGIIREVLKHKQIEKLTLVELDEAVISFSRKHLPFLSQGAFDDPRLSIVIEDGAKFVKSCNEKFDLIIIDSPDPVGEALVLFSEEFYQNCKTILNEDGIFVNQAGVPFMQDNELAMIHKGLSKTFSHVDFFFAAIPTYIGGLMAFGVGSQKPLHKDNNLLQNKIQEDALLLNYYNKEIHRASFTKPQFIKNILENSCN